MSLNYDLGKIANYEQVCFLEAPADIPSQGIMQGDRMMNPVTQTLVWSTIAVDLGSITEANAAEFFARLRLVERLDGPFLIRPEGPDGKRPEGSAAFVTEDEVLAHVGLSCNVSTMTRSQWLRKIAQSHGRDLDHLAARFKNRVAAAV